MDNAPTSSALAAYEATLPFALDPFQREAIAVLERGESVMVAAPTGTGKTAVAEFAVWAARRRGGRVLYTTPVKALSNQKFRDLRALYGDAVGLLTGDVTENGRAPILVMTTEVVRNMLIQTPWELDTVDAIVFDEVHYLADPERGTTWEEAIILCPEHIQIICLSATVSNADEIAAWISRTHRPIELIMHNERAVPLALHYYLDGALQLVIDRDGRRVADFSHIGGEQFGNNANNPRGRGYALAMARRARRRDAPFTEEEDVTDGPPERDEPTPTEVVTALQRQGLLPAIYFQFSRRDCEVWAQHALAQGGDFVPTGAGERIETIIAAHLATLAPEDQALGQVESTVRLVRGGIGFHHAGLLPVLKQLVETLFTAGLMSVVYATDTLALGVNMPARTCVIGRMRKYDGRRRRPLIPNEFQQMSGRAGRRGMDALGNVVVPYSPYTTFQQTLDIATGALHPVRSAFTVRYNTVLNLWNPPEGSRVRQLLSRSLMQFQATRLARGTGDELAALDERIAAVPMGCLIGYPEGDALLEEYRALVRTRQAAEARERRARDDEARLLTLDDERPWKEPTRHVLRQAFRTMPAGALAHVHDRGWGVYLGRPASNAAAVGLFLFGLTTDAPPTVDTVVEYRQIDHLPAPDMAAALPDALRELIARPAPPSADEVVALLAPETWAGLREAIAALGLPDLDGWLAEHRAARIATRRDEVNAVREDLTAARAEGERLAATITTHVCDACPVREEHRRSLGLRERLGRERQVLFDQAAQEAEADEANTRSLIRGIADVLHHFGYLHRGQPTAKADVLADIFDTNGLVIAEVVERDLLHDLRPEDVAEAFSWFAYDRDARFENTFELPRHLLALREELDDLTNLVLATERRAGLAISTGYHPLFYGAARAWCRGAAMERVAEKIALSEGDLVLTFNKTLDLMRQVRTMLAQVRPDHPLVDTLAAAERRVRRGIVEQSYTLGFMPVPVPEEGASDAQTVVINE